MERKDYLPMLKVYQAKYAGVDKINHDYYNTKHIKTVKLCLADSSAEDPDLLEQLKKNYPQFEKFGSTSLSKFGAKKYQIQGILVESDEEFNEKQKEYEELKHYFELRGLEQTFKRNVLEYKTYLSLKEKFKDEDGSKFKESEYF